MILNIKIRYGIFKDGGTSKAFQIFDEAFNWVSTTPSLCFDECNFTITKPGWYYIKYSYVWDNGTAMVPYWLIINEYKINPPQIIFFQPMNSFSTSTFFMGSIKTNGIPTNVSFSYEEYDPNCTIPMDSIRFTNVIQARNNPYSNLNQETIYSEQLQNLKPNTLYLCKIKLENSFDTILSPYAFRFKTPNTPLDWENQSFEGNYRIRKVSFIDENIGAISFQDCMTQDVFTDENSAKMTSDNGNNWNSYFTPMYSEGCWTLISKIKMINKTTGFAYGANSSPIGNNCLYKTQDEGKTWSLINLNYPFSVEIPEFCYIDQNTWIVAVNHNRFSEGRSDVSTLLITQDGGKTWKESAEKFDANIYSIDFLNANIGVIATNDKKIYRTLDGGLNWELILFNGNFMPIKAKIYNNIWFVAGYPGIKFSTDSGSNWQDAEIFMQTSNRLYGAKNANLTSISFNDSLNGVAGGLDGVVLRTKNGGKSWFFEESGTLNSINDIDFREGIARAVGDFGLVIKKNVSFENLKPIAKAGSDQEVLEGDLVSLDAKSSYDPEVDLISYNWVPPIGIKLDSNSSSNPTFIAPKVEKDTQFVFILQVYDQSMTSLPDTVIIRVKHKALTANAGQDKTIKEDYFIQLDGCSSTAPFGVNNLTYKWFAPKGISLESLNSCNPYFYAPQVKGDTTLVFTLSVGYGNTFSTPDTVLVFVQNILRPVADAGADFIVKAGDTVQLDGSHSFDPNENKLSYCWYLGNNDEVPLSPMFDLKYGNSKINLNSLTSNEGTRVWICIAALDDISHTFMFEEKELENIFVSFNKNGGCFNFLAPAKGVYTFKIDGIEAGSLIIEQGLLDCAYIEKPTFRIPENSKDTTFVFSLMVNNGEYDSNVDRVMVSVKSNYSEPISNAGPDQTVNEGTTVELDGSASYAMDGNAMSYTWTAPPGITLSSTSGVAPTFVAPEVSTDTNFTFTLVVNDGTIDSEIDQIVVTVKNVNKIPIANAGPDQTVAENITVILNGTASYDPDGNTLSYIWTAPPGIALSSTSEAMPNFVVTEVATDKDFTFTLVVNDGTLNSEIDQVVVTVKNVNKIPIANAGEDQTVDENTTVTLNASASHDPNGNALTYTWYVPSGISLNSASDSTPTFTAPEVSTDTTFNFMLVVNDGFADSPSDQVKITVLNVSNTSSPKLDTSNTLRVYPNPTSGLIEISVVGLQVQDYKIEVYNSLGQLKLAALKSAAEKVSKINLSSFTNGIYLIKVTTNNQSYHQKIIKK